MPTTRSASKQTKLEDVAPVSKNVANAKKPAPKADRKRKADSKEGATHKKSRSVPEEHKQDEANIITIARAPVLELWASCVAEFLYPSAS